MPYRGTLLCAAFGGVKETGVNNKAVFLRPAAVWQLIFPVLLFTFGPFFFQGSLHTWLIFAPHPYCVLIRSAFPALLPDA